VTLLDAGMEFKRKKGRNQQVDQTMVMMPKVRGKNLPEAIDYASLVACAFILTDHLIQQPQSTCKNDLPI
jgi:ABC-type thiamine transport system substrate-binding protein